MKIGIDVNRVTNAYSSNYKSDKTKDSRKAAGDKVDISNVGRELSKYVELAKNSELSNKKVDEIKNLISNNQYSVDSSALAQNILEYIKGSDK